MMNVCLIPARGGSKSIPLKNITNVNGKPLIWWVLNAANNSNLDIIHVATDSDEIKRVVVSFNFKKVNVINRSDKTSTDESTTESVMEDFHKEYEYDNLILIQATSPLLKTEHINESLDKFNGGKWDSLLTLVRKHNFQWEDDGGEIKPKYDYLNRPRRQDHDGYLIENGALYITTKEAFDKSKCRISGDITYFEMPEYTSYEIDVVSDISVIEGILGKRKTYIIDIDNTICTQEVVYENAKPFEDRIIEYNKLYDEGHDITYWTARGTTTGIDWTELTTKQLKSWGVRYHKLKLGKPHYDIFIDDKSINPNG